MGKLYAFKECFGLKKPTGILLLAYRMGLDGDFPAVLCLFVAEKSFSAVPFATEKTIFFVYTAMMHLKSRTNRDF